MTTATECPCGCPAEMHVGEIGCPCGLPDESPCVKGTRPVISATTRAEWREDSRPTNHDSARVAILNRRIIQLVDALEAYTDADRMREVAQIRAEFVDNYTTRRIDHREGDCTTEQIRGWENEAYAVWRDRHPALNSLLHRREQR